MLNDPGCELAPLPEELDEDICCPAMQPRMDILCLQSAGELSGKTLASESITCKGQKDEKMDEEKGDDGGDRELDEETVAQKDEAGEVEVEDDDEQNAEPNPASSFEFLSSETAVGEEQSELERRFCCNNCCCCCCD